MIHKNWNQISQPSCASHNEWDNTIDAWEDCIVGHITQSSVLYSGGQ